MEASSGRKSHQHPGGPVEEPAHELRKLVEHEHTSLSIDPAVTIQWIACKIFCDLKTIEVDYISPGSIFIFIIDRLSRLLSH